VSNVILIASSVVYLIRITWYWCFAISGVDGRNESLQHWLCLEELPCVVFTEFHSTSSPNEPPLQRCLSSNLAIALSVVPGFRPRRQSEMLFYRQTDREMEPDGFQILSSDDVLPFGDHGKTKIFNSKILGHILADVEVESELAVLRSNLLLPEPATVNDPVATIGE
jgi:hypothetical protein